MFKLLKKIFSQKNKEQEIKKENPQKSIRELFDDYCELNPEADECREYDV